MHANNGICRYELSHAYAENWNPAGKVRNCVLAYSSISIWMARPWTDNQLRGVFLNQFIQRYLIIPEHGNIGTFEDKILVDIPSK